VDLIYPSELRSKVASLQASGMILGPWTPVQLNVTRPKRREAMRRSMFHTILQNLEDIQLVELELQADIDVFILEIKLDDDMRNLIGLIRDRAVYLDLSRRDEGTVTFAIDRDYMNRIKGNIVSLSGVTVNLIEE
jgi:hypothetical protein